MLQNLKKEYIICLKILAIEFIGEKAHNNLGIVVCFFSGIFSKSASCSRKGGCL